MNHNSYTNIHKIANYHDSYETRQTRWQEPVKKKEIKEFYSRYANFIISAQIYRNQVLGYNENQPKTVDTQDTVNMVNDHDNGTYDQNNIKVFKLRNVDPLVKLSEINRQQEMN